MKKAEKMNNPLKLTQSMTERKEMNSIDDVQKPVGKFAQFTDGIWREVTKGSAGVPLYTHPAADVQELVEPIALEKVYETIVQWDEGGGKRSRRELAKQIIDLYTNTPAADVAELMAQEREACAKVVEENANAFIESRMFHDLLQSNADEIRARGGK